MKAKTLKMATAVCCTMLALSCAKQTETAKSELTTVGNPYLPLWEHIPDGEPYVFEDPDQPNSVYTSMARTTILKQLTADAIRWFGLPPLKI